RLDVSGALGGIAERQTQAIGGGVQAALGVDEDAGRPQPVPQLVACHHLTRPLEQGVQQPKRLPLQLQPHALFTQLAGPEVELEDAEAGNRSHDCTSRALRLPLLLVVCNSAVSIPAGAPRWGSSGWIAIQPVPA